MRGIAACHLDCIPGYLTATKYTKTSVSYTYQSVTQGIAVCQLKCTPEYQSETKYMNTCQLHCTPIYQSVTWRIHLECIDLPEYRSATKYAKTCQLHCSPVYQSVTQDNTVSDKVYENLSDIVYPGVSFSVLVNDAGYGRSGVYARVSTYL